MQYVMLYKHKEKTYETTMWNSQHFQHSKYMLYKIIGINNTRSTIKPQNSIILFYTIISTESVVLVLDGKDSNKLIVTVIEELEKTLEV